MNFQLVCLIAFAISVNANDASSNTAVTGIAAMNANHNNTIIFMCFLVFCLIGVYGIFINRNTNNVVKSKNEHQGRHAQPPRYIVTMEELNNKLNEERKRLEAQLIAHSAEVDKLIIRNSFLTVSLNNREEELKIAYDNIHNMDKKIDDSRKELADTNEKLMEAFQRNNKTMDDLDEAYKNIQNMNEIMEDYKKRLYERKAEEAENANEKAVWMEKCRILKLDDLRQKEQFKSVSDEMERWKTLFSNTANDMDKLKNENLQLRKQFNEKEEEYARYIQKLESENDQLRVSNIREQMNDEECEDTQIYNESNEFNEYYGLNKNYLDEENEKN